ncbi:MAG: TIGR00730 family Rossman fold protein [Desulfobacterales bacterium]|nr:TIGR00730 family Rossman fold protein [Desulfobacterales bacterium]
MTDRQENTAIKGPARDLGFHRSNGPIDRSIDELMDATGGIRRPAIVRELLLAALKAGQEDDGQADLKLMNTALKEMRYTAKIFGPYRDRRKVTVFGSARTPETAPLYQMARQLGRELVAAGHMVITGGGAGIMQAINEGAGPENSFGVNIRLPFEQKPNPVIAGNPRNILYKYFFNRKVAFLKEAQAVVLFPGGFGTLDEAMETLTLLQTGKQDPLPLVLIDVPGGTYWTRWVEFIKESLAGAIDKEDLALFRQVDTTSAAVAQIERFYRRYHSLRYVGEKLVLRLSRGLETKAVADLSRRFGDILVPGGAMVLSDPLTAESNEEGLAHLQRLVVDFNRARFCRLRLLIDAINDI